MKLLKCLLFLCVFPTLVYADVIVEGSTDVSVFITLRSSSNSTLVTGKTYSDMTLYCIRTGTTPTSISPITLASETTAHSDGGFVETSVTGLYRVDLPDSCVAAGVDNVVISAATSGTFTTLKEYELRSVVAETVSNTGFAQSSTSGSITLSTSESSSDDVYNKSVVAIIGGTGEGQFRCVSDYTGSSKVATIDTNWSVNPDTTSRYLIMAQNSCKTVDSNIVSVTDTPVSDIDDFKLTVAEILNTDVEDWATGLGMYIDYIKKYVSNKLTISGSNYTIYKDDGITTFDSGTTGASGRDPS